MPANLANNPHCTVLASPSTPGSGGLLYPGPGWTGVAGSGGAAPTESPTLHGSGWPQKVIGACDQPEIVYLDDNMQITIGAEHGDPAHVEKVICYAEGNSVEITSWSKNTQTGSFGWVVTVPYSFFAINGEADFYFKIVPFNGFERLLPKMRVIRLADADRPLRYLNFATGNNANNGLTPSTAWKTAVKAQAAAPSGAICWMADGTYFEDSNAGTINNAARPIEFRCNTGRPMGSVLITRTTRLLPETRWNVRCAHSIWKGIQFDCSKIPFYWGGSGVSVFQNCKWADPNGPLGDPNGYQNYPPAQVDVAQTYFRNNEGQRNYLLESEMVNYVTTGCRMMRNVNLTASTDTVFFGGDIASSNTSMWNVFAKVRGYALIRLHADPYLTVAGAAYDSATDRTTITWAGSPVIQQVALGAQPNENLRIRSSSFIGGTGDLTKGSNVITNVSNPGSWAVGMLIGVGDAAGGISPTQKITAIVGNTMTVVGYFGGIALPAFEDATGIVLTREFLYYSQDTASATSVVVGDASYLASGATAFGYIVYHSDTCQLGIQATGATNIENIFIQRYRTDSEDSQPMLWQAGGYSIPGTVNTVGTAATFSSAQTIKPNDFIHLTAGPQAGEWRRVETVIDSQHVTLASAFSADQTARTCNKAKCAKDVGIQLTILDHKSLSITQAQFQHGLRHFVMRQCTQTAAWDVPGVTAGLAGIISLRNALVQQFGLEGCVVAHSILKSTVNDAGVPFPDASTGLDFQGTHFEAGTIRGTGGAGGYTTYDSQFRPTAVSLTIPAGEAKIPFDYHGNALANDGSDLVGAVA